MADAEGHWDRAYARGAERVSWFEPSPRVSLEIVSALAILTDVPVIDVGGGASRLAAELVARGHEDVSVLDLSEVALRHAREDLGGAVTWIHADVRTWWPERQYMLWHDRAVLHFFTDEGDRAAYLRVLDAAVADGGFVVLGTFAPDAPPECSGLPVLRYTGGDLAQLLGSGYARRVERHDVHVTPGGARQPFTWAAFERQP